MNVTDPRSIVAAKRDGATLTEADIRAIVEGYTRGEIPDYLAAAFLMACFIHGLDDEETLALTRAMVDSGTTLSLASVDRPKVDKHSTGGVADSVTLVFAPLAASLGVAVAKLSGRGLGHTGGTLDKLESIPGLRTDLSPDRLERQVAEVGCAVAAQSADIVPADGAIYALRDATATVESIPLIAASVMSKKLAVESDVILLDVKAGSGAFMRTPHLAAELAGTCASIAAGWGRRMLAAVTDMSQPLGRAVGNALDIAEAVDVLKGAEAGRLGELCVTLAAEALARAAHVEIGEARARSVEALASGAALERFAQMVQAQGGDPRVTDDPWSVLPRADVVHPIVSTEDGFLAAVEAAEVGRAAIDLGAGRHRKGDPIDHAVGIVFAPKVGDRVGVGERIGEVHARREEDAEVAARRVLAALSFSDEAVRPPPLIYGWHGTDP